MTTLALTLAAIVAALVWIWWDIGWQFRRHQRALNLAWERGHRRAEDQAWALHRQADYELAILITEVRAGVLDVERLVTALERVRVLEVVA